MRLPVAALAALVALVALAGCFQPVDDHHDGVPGDGHHHNGGGTGEGAGNLPVTGDEDRLIEVTGGEPSEFRFTPERIEVEAGQRVGIRFTNEGDAAHEWAVDALGFHLHAGPGETEEGAFIAPEPGEYVIGCYLPGHFEAGMKGTLVVT